MPRASPERRLVAVTSQPAGSPTPPTHRSELFALQNAARSPQECAPPVARTIDAGADRADSRCECRSIHAAGGFPQPASTAAAGIFFFPDRLMILREAHDNAPPVEPSSPRR